MLEKLINELIDWVDDNIESLGADQAVALRALKVRLRHLANGYVTCDGEYETPDLRLLAVPKGYQVLWTFPAVIPAGWIVVPWPDDVDFAELASRYLYLPAGPITPAVPLIDEDGNPAFVIIEKL